MQDRYVGDVGDYGKFGLLRALAGHPGGPVRLAVVWCTFPDEGHNGDGRHVAYLRNGAMAALDLDLHGKLRRIVEGGSRSIRAIESAGVLPRSTIFFGESPSGLSAGGDTLAGARRLHREIWLSRALDETRPADLVFLDPDNGVATPATQRNGPRSGKFVFSDELVPFWTRGQSLVVYHHLNRTCTATEQVAVLGDRLAAVLGREAILMPLLFRRGSCRVFWVIAQPRHDAALAAACRGFLERGWASHFGPFAPLQSTTTSAGPVPSQSTLIPKGASTDRSTKSSAALPRRLVRASGST